MKWVKPGYSAVTPAVSEEGILYFVISDTRLYALDTATGLLKWQKNISGGIGTALALDEVRGQLYFGTGYPSIVALDQQTGEYKWSFPTQHGDKDQSNPSVGPDGTVYAGSRNGHVYAFDPETGVVKWELQAEHPVFAQPVINDRGMILVGEYVLDINDGHKLWQCTDDWWYLNYGNWIVGDGGIHLFPDNRNLMAIDPATGQKSWQISPGAEIRGLTAVNNDRIYFGMGDGTVCAVDGQTGAIAWRYPTTSSMMGVAPAFGPGGLIYIPGNDGTLYALQTSSTGLAGSAWPTYRRDSFGRGCLPQTPRLVEEPQPQVVKAGSPLELCVSVNGQQPLSYTAAHN